MLHGMDNEVPDPGDDDVIDLRSELYFVQRQLERMATMRLSHMLSPAEEEAYRLLGRREVALILELADNPLRPTAPRPTNTADRTADVDARDASVRDDDIWLDSSGPEISFT